MVRLDSKQLRAIPVAVADGHSQALERRPLYFILENIYDTYNVGGIFRLADALAVSKIFLCGDTEVPPNHKIQKASVGTYKIVPWEYKHLAVEAIAELRKTCNVKRETFDTHNTYHISHNKEINELHNSGKSTLHATRYTLRVYAVEQSKNSIPYTSADFSLPLALVLGNETFGVTEETLKAVDQVVEIPMWGINKSLNVIVSAAIVAYHAVGKL